MSQWVNFTINVKFKDEKFLKESLKLLGVSFREANSNLETNIQIKTTNGYGSGNLSFQKQSDGFIPSFSADRDFVAVDEAALDKIAVISANGKLGFKTVGAVVTAAKETYAIIEQKARMIGMGYTVEQDLVLSNNKVSVILTRN
jgi:hypothetical protein